MERGEVESKEISMGVSKLGFINLSLFFSPSAI